MYQKFKKIILHYLLCVVNYSLFGGCFWILISCISVRYVAVESYNPATITFPANIRRILIVNNALPQEDVPFESSLRKLPEQLQITSDSTTFDFCRTLGEVLADFSNFDDIRLLEGCYRKELSPFNATTLKQEDVIQLCYEHEADVVVSLDQLLFSLHEKEDVFSFFEKQGIMNVYISGMLRIYFPSLETPMTSILLADTIISDFSFIQNNENIWDILFTVNETNLLRESARFLANEVRINFIPYWSQDIRWYYVSLESKWKEASVYAESDKWQKALNLWKTLYSRAPSWKQKARLASNIALGAELVGDLEEALEYANLSYHLMREHLGEEDSTTKNQKTYFKVLSNRITEVQKIRMQLTIDN